MKQETMQLRTTPFSHYPKMKFFRKQSTAATKNSRELPEPSVDPAPRRVFRLPDGKESSEWDMESIDETSLYTSPLKESHIGSRIESGPSAQNRQSSRKVILAKKAPTQDDDGPQEKSVPSLSRSEVSVAVYSTTTAALANALLGPLDGDKGENLDENSSQITSGSSFIDFELGARLNMSDAELMEDKGNPGVLRLTEDGLKRHELKSTELLLRQPDPFQRRGYIGWKLSRERAQVLREKLAERDERLKKKVALKQVKPKRSVSTKSIQSVRSTWSKTEVHSQAGASSPSLLGRKTRFRPAAMKIDCTDLSVAPLDVFEDAASSSYKYQNVDSRQEIMRRKERERQREAERLKQSEEARERARIERLRRAAIERQRKLNSGPAMHKKQSLDGSRTLSSWSKSSTPLIALPEKCSLDGVECFIAEGDEKSNGVPMAIMSDASLGSSTAATSLSSLPCAVCSSGEREFIAIPCMHFCFCKGCVEKSLQTDKVCPVCRATDVTFSRVRG